MCCRFVAFVVRQTERVEEGDLVAADATPPRLTEGTAPGKHTCCGKMAGPPAVVRGFDGLQGRLVAPA